MGQQILTARDEETGRTVKFEWHDATPPTEEDLAEVFAAAGSNSNVGTPTGLEPPPEHPHARFGRLIKENLPAIGGAVGGLLGARGGSGGSIALAGLGGMAGRLAQRTIDQEPVSPGELLKDTALSGGIQGAAEGVGQGAGKLLRIGGQRLYSGLLKASNSLLDEYPDLVNTLIKIKAPISGKGIGMADRATVESSAKAKDILQKAAPGAAPTTSSEIIPEFSGTIDKLRTRRAIGQPSELSAVLDRGVRLAKNEPPQGYDLLRAQELKQAAQDAAHAGYRQAERGTVKEVSADTMLDADVARGFRKAIEKRAPEVGPVNRRTQSLMGAKSALEDAVQRESKTLSVGGAKDFLGAGLGVAGYSAGLDPQTAGALGILTRILATPSLGSRAAIKAVQAGEIAPSVIPQLLRLLSVSHDER